MSHSASDLINFRSNSSRRSNLDQFCGSKQLFSGRYGVLRVLGKGGFGVTFLARDMAKKNHPLCVIKQLCPKVSDPIALQRACKRFEREAKMLHRLGSHPQIPKLFHYFQAEGEFYLVQEYIRGYTLARLIRSRGPLAESAVQQFLKEVLPILKYVHGQQVIHRDIKPPNLLRCKDDGRLVLIDFGAVKEQIAWLEETTTKALTTHFIGTVGFAPPEQLSLRPVYATDIYAVGVTCLYLLTGNTPMQFDCDPMTGQILWRDAVQVSPLFSSILDKMLQASLDKRYRTVDEILHDLGAGKGNLAQYMSVQQPKPDEGESAADEYLTPAARRAMAIREWRTRLQVKKGTRQNSAKLRKLFSTSTNPQPR